MSETGLDRPPKQSNAWNAWGILGLVVIAVLVWFFVFKEDDADPNAPSEGGAPSECYYKDKPLLKTQTMNNATVHMVSHGNKDIELGSLTHFGILNGIKLTAKAKEQGWGNQCSSFTLNVMRDGKSIASIKQKLGRNKEYKTFSLAPEVKPGTLVQVGDSVRMTIKAWYPGCATWIKDIVAVVTVLG